MKELIDLHDALGLAELLRRREVSSTELVQMSLDRIGGDITHAFITVTADRALAEAAEADRRLDQPDPPPFCGIPTALKDLTATAGVRTTRGSALLADDVPDRDEPVVQRVRAAGFISVGKTNTPEFGLSSYTDNDVSGPTVTPWDPTRNAGGSSGGAAAAVAAHLVPVAFGSDGGGSIRIPASCCGVIGYKPSRGLVTDAWSGLVTDGALTRTVRDTRAMVELLAGRRLPIAPVRPLRIARWVDPYLDFVSVSESSRQAWEQATQVLRGLGHEVVDLADPWPAALEPQFNVVWSSGIAAAPIPAEADPLLRATTRYWRERGARQSATDLVTALDFLQRTTDEVLATLTPFDAFLTPTLALPPQPVDWFTGSGDPVEDHRRELLFTPYTALMNMSGQPAVSLPLAVVDGLPAGIMLAAHRNDDGRLLDLCEQVEQAAGFVTWR